MRFTKRCGRGVALIALAGSAVALLPTSAPADTLSTFDALAAANGLDVTAANASIPLGLVVQGTAPVARAALDSLGTSQALAAGPYPGDLAASLPGTVKTTSGIPLPDYPLMAATSAGDEPKEVVAPGMSLRAESRASRSTSRATLGSDSTGSTAIATAERDDAGGVRAKRVRQRVALQALHERADDRHPRPVRGGAAGLPAAAPDGANAFAARHLGGLGRQPRLPDAGLASDQHDAAPLGEAGQRRGQHGQLAIATDEHAR